MDQATTLPRTLERPVFGYWDRRALQAISNTLPFLEIRDAEKGGLEFIDPEGQLTAHVHARKAGVFRRILCGGSLAGAETYVRGEWDCAELTNLIRLFIRNNLTADRLDGWLSWLMNSGNRIVHALRRNSPQRSRVNIAAHYDLGTDFFRLWLDPTLSYSSGIFRSDSATLEDASREKMNHVCRKLRLAPAERLLEIGCGWGALAVHAAEQHGCRVTATTSSQDQAQVALQRARQSQASNNIELLTTDYRQLNGTFDRLVSIEMIEAVGHRYYDTFFRQCSQLLQRQGTMLLQAIILPEQRFAAYRKSVDFIQRYIFPGGALPSLGILLKSIGRVSDLRLVEVEDFTADYARTLRYWKETFLARQEEVLQLGFSKEFLRLWTYYLCYCEALFAERYASLLHLRLAKPAAD